MTFFASLCTISKQKKNYIVIRQCPPTTGTTVRHSAEGQKVLQGAASEASQLHREWNRKKRRKKSKEKKGEKRRTEQKGSEEKKGERREERGEKKRKEKKREEKNVLAAPVFWVGSPRL